MSLTSGNGVLSRYRSLRTCSLHHQTEALGALSGAAIIAQAKRLGLTSGKKIVASEDELPFIFDLALYTAPPNRSRTIDRYARAIKSSPGSDDTVILGAMRDARFSLWQIQGRHELAGLVVDDIIRNETIWLMDEGLEQSADVGLIVGSRLFPVPDGFWMTCGASVFPDEMMLADVLDACACLQRREPKDAANDRRFAESLYRRAIAEFGIPALQQTAA